MSSSMENLVARFHDVGDIRLETEPIPGIGPGEALVRTAVCGICTGDLMGWYLKRKAPLVFGHEVTGEIEAVGEGVVGFAPGDRVAVHHHAPCMDCRRCRRGDYVHCAQWRSSRLDPGGMARYFRVPRENLEHDTLKLPDGVDFDRGALVEPTACVVKSLRRARLSGGERMLVIGLGIMGQLHVALAKRYGAAEVFGTDFERARCERAGRIGADATFVAGEVDVADALADATGGEMAETVIVGPGSPEAIALGIRCAAPGGTVVLFTTTKPEERVSLDAHDLYFREVSLVPSYSCGPDDTREALRLLAEGALPVDELVTHRFPFDRIVDAYAAASDLEHAIKTLVVF